MARDAWVDLNNQSLAKFRRIRHFRQIYKYRQSWKSSSQRVMQAISIGLNNATVGLDSTPVSLQLA